jgi:GNAT superfamily N-acetyltransferase
MESIEIRPATPADLPTIVEFNRALAWESEQLTLPNDTLERGVATLLADPAKGFYTMAEQGNIPVGQTLITYEWSDWRNGWFWWIQSVYVVADARGRGVFRTIFHHLQELAVADETVIGLRLYVERENTQAQTAYTKLGLAEEHYNLMGLYPLPGRQAAW